MKRINTLDGVRALLAISITLVHVLKNTPPSIGAEDYQGIFHYIAHGENAVKVFFMISAFSLCCGYFEKFKMGKISVNDFYKRRYSRIMPFWFIICSLGLLAEPSLLRLHEYVLNMSLLYKIQPLPNIELIGVGWFLGSVFTFYILFPWFIFLIWTKKRAVVMLILSILLSQVMANYCNLLHFQKFTGYFISQMPFFIAGGVLYHFHSQIIDYYCQHKWTKWLVYILTGWCSFVFVDEYPSLVISIVMCSSFIVFAVTNKDNRIMGSKPMSLISKYSMEIYLSHMMVFRVVEKCGLVGCADNEYVSFFICASITFVGALLFSMLSVKTIDLLADKCLKKNSSR